MVAKHIGHGFIAALLLPVEQIAPGGGIKPVVHPYNFVAHEPVAAARFF
jgi:hypothetical protein